MRATTKLATFAVVVAVVFGAAWAVGAAVGPVDVGDDNSHTAHNAAAVDGGELPRGLSVAQSGYRLVAEAASVAPGAMHEFAFRILDDEGAPVTAFQELHERALHLIVLSRNLVDYWHLHPTMDESGRWSVDLPALAAGSYRVFADFQPENADNLTLGIDIAVPGTVQPAVAPAAADVATVDEYTVRMKAAPTVGDNELSFTVERGGEIVTTEPYLGAAGHLIAIRAGDMAFLHVHPHTGDSATVTFTGELPTAGTYRLFFDFSHDGVVRTAAFTVIVPDQMSMTETSMTETSMTETSMTEAHEGH